MKAEDREVIDRINRLAQELMDRDWLELDVSQGELDQSRLLEQQFYAELDAGYSIDEIQRRWEERSREKVQQSENTSASARTTRPKHSQKYAFSHSGDLAHPEKGQLHQRLRRRSLQT